MSLATCISAYRAQAEARLDAAAWHYLLDGSPESAQNAATRAFDDITLIPRPLRDLRGGHTRLQLLGQSLEHPLLLAPIAYQRLFHADGEVASAMAASAQGATMVVSSLASQPLETISAAADRPLWFQLYWQGDRQRALRLLRRAEAAGYAVVMFTVDAPIKLATMQLPDGVDAVNLETPVSPAPTFDGSAVFDGWLAQAPRWEDLAWLRKQTHLPLLVKGLLHPDDAEQAIDLGVDGIVVSNHGGRVLMGTPASIVALPMISERVAGRVPILLDSGIRSGRDAFIALSLGASAVMIGRPAIWGLAANGAMGVAHVIRLLRDELEMTMALTGCRELPQTIPPNTIR